MKGFSFIVIAAFLWALDSIIRYPLLSDGLSAETIVFYEHLVLCLIFSVFFLKNIKNFLNLKVEDILYFIVLGAGGSAIATLAFTQAFTLINPSLVILIQKLQPVVAVILARIVLKETIRPQFLFWAALCVLGAVLISAQDLYEGLKNVDFSNFWETSNIKGYIYTAVAVLGSMDIVFGEVDR